MPITEYMPKRDFDKLRAEYLALTTEATMVIEERDQLRADLAASQAECERLRADAERYRYLRNTEDGIEFRDGNNHWRSDCPNGDELDEIIDAARAGKAAT